jgi:DNA invertase Pin-like site-specific DNA recombinase
VRVSTPEQDYELQRAAIERAAAARGDTELTWYAETRSGRSWVRPELEKLARRAASGHHARIYVWRLDRLTRRGPADTLATVQRLRQSGCQLISVTEGFDFAGAVGELLVAMMGFLAAGESEAQLERQKAARARVEAAGGKWGRPPKVTALDAVRILALASEGRSVRSIAMAVKLKRSTVQDTIERHRLARAALVDVAIAGPES